MLKNEWKAILKHKFFIIVILALALVPAIYNYIFLGSMWDPYGNLNRLPVAVVNLDKPSELDGQTLKIGNDLVKELKKTKNLDYHFVSEKTATDGIKSGKYYMKVTLPEAFSSQAASLMTKNPKLVQVDYQTTSGHNYISSKMSESAMNQLKAEVSNDITKQYTTSIFEQLDTLKSGMKEAQSGSEKLANGATTAQSGSKELTTHLDTLAKSSLSFNDGANALEVGLKQYLSGVSQASNGATQLSSGTQQYVAGVNQASSGAKDLSNGTQQYVAGVNQVADGTSTLADGATSLSKGTQDLASGTKKLTDQIPQLVKGIETLQAGLSTMNQATDLNTKQPTDLSTQREGITKLENGLDQLNQAIQMGATASNPIANQLATIATNLENIKAQFNAQKSAVEATSAFKSLSPEKQAELLGAMNQNSQLDIETAQGTLNQIQGELSQMATQNKALAGNANALLPNAKTSLGNLVSGIDSAHVVTGEMVEGLKKTTSQFPALTAGAKDLTYGSQAVAAHTAELSAGTSAVYAGVKQLQTKGSTLTAGTSQLSSGLQKLQLNGPTLSTGTLSLVEGLNKLQANSPSLASGSNQLADGASKISSGSTQLAKGSSSLTDGLVTLSDGTTKLSSALGDASDKLEGTHNTKQNAQAVAKPVTLKHSDPDNVKKNGVGMTPYMVCVALFIGAIATNVVIGTSFSGKQWKKGSEFMLAKIGTHGVVALLQAIIVYGAVYLLGLRPNYPLKTLFAVILISFAFMAISTFFVTWLGKVGDFLLIVLLVLQLATSAGTYPLQLSDQIFQNISPYLPMTYGLRMLRQTIGLSGTVGWYVLGFILIIVVFTGLLSFFKKISRLA